MAVQYMDNEHKESSGYVVSGKEARLIKEQLFNKSKEAKLKVFKNTSDSIKRLIKSISH